MVGADRASNYIFCRQTGDQTTRTALDFVHHLGNIYGLPKEVQTDNGPAFFHLFDTEMAKVGIDHQVPAPYCPVGNGAAERVVGKVKKFLGNLGQQSGESLQALLYGVHNTPSNVLGARLAFQ